MKKKNVVIRGAFQEGVPGRDPFFPLPKTVTVKGLYTLFTGRDFDAMEKVVRAVNEYAGLVAALRALKAESMPFAPKEKGGLGLPYSPKHLSQEAWAERRADAWKKADAALALAGLHG